MEEAMSKRMLMDELNVNTISLLMGEGVRVRADGLYVTVDRVTYSVMLEMVPGSWSLRWHQMVVLQIGAYLMHEAPEPMWQRVEASNLSIAVRRLSRTEARQAMEMLVGICARMGVELRVSKVEEPPAAPPSPSSP